jgi:hypothetical protein
MDGVDADASLYEVDAKAAQGKIYVRAFCPGVDPPVAVVQHHRLAPRPADPGVRG